MCGIAGVFHYKSEAGQVDVSQLKAVRDTMQLRGPDDEGIWVSAEGQIGLAHRRLSVIDTSIRGRQPMPSSDAKLQIVYNGEVYNYKELRSKLQARGHSFHTRTDTEVLLAMYREHGRSMLEHLRGMFAFAIWDERKQELFCARDPFGIKPLYYSDNQNGFFFASQVKSILRFKEIDRSPSAAGHAGFFLLGSVPEPYTLFEQVKQLPAGSFAVVSNSAVAIEPYVSIADEQQAGQASSADRNARAENILSALSDSIEHHLISDVPLGFFLSAGIDSNALVALASAKHSGELHTATLGFEEFRGTADDETLLAELAAKEYQTQHQTHWVSQKDFSAHAQDFFRAMDQPSIDGANSYFVSKAAKDAGLTVALSGLGSDELFGGYPSFSQVPKLQKAMRLPPGAGAVGKIFRILTAPIFKMFSSPKYASLFEYGGSMSGAYFLRRGLFMPWELPNVMDAEMARDGWAELSPMLLAQTDSKASAFNQVSHLELTRFMRNQTLRDTDWASMAHSLEVRVPFVDWTLFSQSAHENSISPEILKRELFSQVEPKILPQILNRPKTGFMVPVQDWLSAGKNSSSHERGHRGWARYVHDEYLKTI